MSLAAPFRHALPPPDGRLGDLIHVTYAGWVRVGAGESRDNHPPQTPAFFRYQWHQGRTLPEFCVVLIREGEGELETRQGTQRIRSGNAFLLRPGEWHRHRPLRNTGWTNLWIAFNGGLPRDWMFTDSFNLKGNIAVIDHYELFLAQFEHLLASVHHSPAENTAGLSCQLIGLLSHMLRTSSGGQVHHLHKDELVSRALALIWGGVLESMTVPAVAGHLDCGRRSLERRFKEGAGRSVLDEIQACRIDRARRLIVETHIPLKECATRAGFNTCEHMRQVFRKQFGISPEALRKERGETGPKSHFQLATGLNFE
ncbi:MAG: AraC family transcriptional regulator [Akkermansiaceae bacterium]|nr:AraC family transcriptional regulator [Akkermansiaceae bacterium]MCF7731995.1 AraC family transcriptional regulator [Akkermansiaceae bacterium]